LKILNSKTEIKRLLSSIEESSFLSKHSLNFIHKKLLKQKIRFPVLEFLSEELFKRIPVKQQIRFLKNIIGFKEIGSCVIAGKMLQLRSARYFPESLKLAENFIIKGDAWYVCDIIGERVFGHNLLVNPVKTIPVLKKYSRRKNKWMVRCIGVAAHYAIKKGLQKKYVTEVFRLLTSLSHSTDFHTKKGIGWGAKTTAKFHPDIIKNHKRDLKNNPEIKQWFRSKIKIGLSRSYKYASVHQR